MAGFMKNAMQYLGMADVAEDDEPMDIQDEDPGFDDDHSVTPVSQLRHRRRHPRPVVSRIRSRVA